jgi:hypothetical protein
MAGRLYNLNVADQAHTYDSGGQLPFPGVMIGNETANVSVAPDNDAGDRGVDIAANFQNGTGPQLDGHNPGVYIDLDTGEGECTFPYVGGVDDSDPNYNSDAAVLGESNQRPDQGILAVHLSGTGDHTVDGPGQEAEAQPVAGHVADGGTTGVELVDFDHA